MNNIDPQLAQKTLIKIVLILNIGCIVVSIFGKNLSLFILAMCNLSICCLYFILGGLSQRAEDFVEFTPLGQKIDAFAGRNKNG